MTSRREVHHSDAVDSLGWTMVGMTVAGLFGSSLWGRRENRLVSKAARAWAQSVGLAELPFGKEGVAGDLAVRRMQTLPSFVGTLGSHPVSVLATSTRPRFGRLWVFCTHAPQHPPVFAGHVMGFRSASVFGRAKPKDWEPAKLGGEIDRSFLISVPPGDDAQRALSEPAKAAMIEAGPRAWCFSVARGGFAVSWFKQGYDDETGAALTSAAKLFEQLLAR